jgi:thiamine-phosphate pyrophosphorylase
LLLCYITDRTQFPGNGNENERRRALLAKIAEAARCGVDLIQLREKDLPPRELEALTHAALHALELTGTENLELPTRLLINSRSDVAIACGADGVHLRSNDISPSETRKIWVQSANSGGPLVSVSCHSVDDVARAAAEGADFAMFAPVFGKKGAPQASAAGLDELRKACRQKIPVLALGGITIDSSRACLDAGSVGIAAIRLFQENEIAKIVRSLRG